MNNQTDAPALLYKSLIGDGAKALDPDSPYYVEILQAEPEKDPILNLWQRITLEDSESVNLLTGFLGNGKSTELRRLKKYLQQDGCEVFLIDMFDYLLTTKPLELSDFILSLMSALADRVKQDTGLDALTLSYWERLGNFLQSELSIDKLDLQWKQPGAAARLGLKLKTEPEFKQQIQIHLRGHLSRLIADAQQYVSDLIDTLRDQRQDPNLKVVLLVDSVEQIRGDGGDAEAVHNSVVELFSGQAANLRFSKLHVVYTIPPYLQALAKNLGRSLGGHPVTSWPNIHIRYADGSADPQATALMKTIIGKRYPHWQELLSDSQIARLASASGGDLRDYFRLIRECALALRIARMNRADASLDDATVNRVEEQLLNELLPIAEADARWLARIHHSKETSLPTTADLPTLARFFDGNLIMNYLNGQPWYDIHPLLVNEVRRFIPDQQP